MKANIKSLISEEGWEKGNWLEFWGYLQIKREINCWSDENKRLGERANISDVAV